MGKNSRRKVKDDPRDTVTDPGQALDMMVDDVHKIVNDAPRQAFGADASSNEREKMMGQVDQQLARFMSVINQQRQTIDRLMNERKELLGQRLVASVMMDRMIEDKVYVSDDKVDADPPHGELLLKMTEGELTGTEPGRYELSIEDWEEDGRRYYCVRVVNPGGPDPVGDEDAVQAD